MLIEQNTDYARRLERNPNPCFDTIRTISNQMAAKIDTESRNKIFESLKGGDAIVQTEEQMLVYMSEYGMKIKSELNRAFEHVEHFNEVNIIDYGCGQGIGTMCYIDVLKKIVCHRPKIRTIHLIDKSEICLKRAVLNISTMYPQAEIKPIVGEFGSTVLPHCFNEYPTLHIFSNVLHLANIEFLIAYFTGTNRLHQFICIDNYHFTEEYDISKEKNNRIISFSRNIGGFDRYTESRKKFYISVFRLEKHYSEDPYIIPDKAHFESSIQQLVIPSNIHYIGKNAFGDSRLLKQVIIQGSINIIDDGVFGGCESLEQVVLPDTVCSIRDHAFSGCASLKQITIPESLKEIGKGAFSGCKSLNKFEIPESVTYIGDGAFYGCHELEQITIPKSVIEIGDKVFGNCYNLKYVYLPSTIEFISIEAFKYSKNIRKIIIPKGCVEHFKDMLDKSFWNKLEEQ